MDETVVDAAGPASIIKPNFPDARDVTYMRERAVELSLEIHKNLGDNDPEKILAFAVRIESFIANGISVKE